MGMYTLKSLRCGFTIMVRPLRGYWEMKYDKRGSYPAACVLAVLALLASLVSVQYTGFIFSGFNPYTFNLLRQVSSLAIPFGLFCVVNWAVTTILNGEGTMGDIFMATCYALLPYTVCSLLSTVLSWFFTQSEGVFLGFVSTLGLLWSALLLFCGIMTVHQYTVKKTLGTFVLTVVGIMLVLFITIMFTSIFDKMFNYFLGLYNEIRLRM